MCKNGREREIVMTGTSHVSRLTLLFILSCVVLAITISHEAITHKQLEEEGKFGILSSYHRATTDSHKRC